MSCSQRQVARPIPSPEATRAVSTWANQRGVITRVAGEARAPGPPENEPGNSAQVGQLSAGRPRLANGVRRGSCSPARRLDSIFLFYFLFFIFQLRYCWIKIPKPMNATHPVMPVTHGMQGVTRSATTSFEPLDRGSGSARRRSCAKRHPRHAERYTEYRIHLVVTLNCVIHPDHPAGPAPSTLHITVY